jgi:regulator of sigma E protease
MNHSSLLWYLGAFALALGILIVFHEMGHYLVARLVGIKVLRFSVGFGKPLLSRRFGADGTEWSLAAFPLGGYVKMLDEREGPVAAEELHRAFNRQSVGRRALVVVAGPVANLLLAVLIYWALFIHGVDEMRPILAAPPAATAAARAGVEDGELVRSVSGTPVTTLQDFRWQVMRQIVDRQPAMLEVINRRGDIAFRNLDTTAVDATELDADFTRILGLAPFRPKLKPVIGLVAIGSVAEEGGIKAGDEVTEIDGQPITHWNELAAAIRAAPGKPMRFVIQGDKGVREIRLVPKAETEGGQTVGRIGIGVRDDPQVRAELMVEVRLQPVAALAKAVRQTWDTSVFSLRMIGRMMVGELSWRNISGPVTIADYAGQSARLGIDHYLKFLALISISLGVLNLLPIPILDGGHLLYYLVEVIKGGPLSERIMEIGQQIGLGLLVLLMAFAFYNDINRLIPG